MTKPKPSDDYPPVEAERRFLAALKVAVNTPPKPQKAIPKKGMASQSKKPRKKIKTRA